MNFISYIKHKIKYFAEKRNVPVEKESHKHVRRDLDRL